MGYEDKYFSKQYSEKTKDDYIHVVKNSDDVWIFHDMEILDSYVDKKKAMNCSVIVYNKSNIPVCIIPLMVYKRNIILFFSINILKSPGSGPAIINGFTSWRFKYL